MIVLSLHDLQNGLAYLKAHPSFLLRAARNAARLRLGVPMDAVRWLLIKLRGDKLPRDLQLQAMPPGLRVAASVDVMGTPMHLSAVLHVEQVLLSVSSIRIQLRARDLGIKAPQGSPMAQMLAMMDLRKPGDLMSFMPVRPRILLDAHGDLFVLDLMKLPQLMRSPLAQRIVSALAEIIAVKELQTEDDLLILSLRAIPMGLPAAVSHLRGG